LYFGKQLLSYLRIFLSAFFRQRASLGCELVDLQSQLAFYKESIRQKKQSRPRFHPAFRLLWDLLSRVWGGWKFVAALMKPKAVLQWRQDAFLKWWRWKSRRKAGRPAIGLEMQALIRRFSRENVLWSAARAHVSISGSCYLALAGEITQLRANANSKTGFMQDVTNQAIWKSSNPAIASVSSTGLVTAVVPGIVEITATYESSYASAGISVATPVDLNGTWTGRSTSSVGTLSWSGTFTQVGDSVSIAFMASGNGLNYTSSWSGTVNGASIFSSGSLSNAGGGVCSWNDGRCVVPNSKELRCVTPMTCVNGFTLSYITAARP